MLSEGNDYRAMVPGYETSERGQEIGNGQGERTAYFISEGRCDRPHEPSTFPNRALHTCEMFEVEIVRIFNWQSRLCSVEFRERWRVADE